MDNDMDARALARKCGMPYIDIEKEIPDRKCVELLKEELARSYNSLPVRFLNGGVLVAIGDPSQKESVQGLGRHIGKKVYPALADKDAIRKAIDASYSSQAASDEGKEGADGGEDVEEESGSRIISIMSNKGGVGKTHVSTNLAKVVADTGKKVLLIDADLGNADISNKLALFPEFTLYDFLLGDTSLESMIEKTAYGFDLIGGSSGEFKLANINYIQRTKFIRGFRKVSEGYDFTIFDLSAGISNTVTDFALASDETLIITTPQDIIAGYACIKATFQRFKQIEEEITRRRADLAVKIELQRREFQQRQAKIYLTVYRQVQDQASMVCAQYGYDIVLRFNGDPVDVENPQSVLTYINRPVVWYESQRDITPIVLDQIRKRLGPGGTVPTAVLPDPTRRPR